VSPGNKILAHALDVETGRAAARPHEAHVSSGVMYPLWVASGALAKRAPAGSFFGEGGQGGQGQGGPPTAAARTYLGMAGGRTYE